MSRDLLSVIILAYNNGKLIYETLKSIFIQNYPNIEIVIANDGDQEFNENSIREYYLTKKSDNIKNFIILNSEENRGTVKNINNAIKQCNGQYIKIIAGDDVYPDKDVFRRQVDMLYKSYSALFAVGNIGECDENLCLREVEGFAPSQVEHLLYNNQEKLLRFACRKNPKIMAVQSCCYRRELFDKIGLFDERLKLIEDLPMIVNILVNKVECVYTNEIDVLHRGSTGISTSRLSFDPKKIAYYEDLYDYFQYVLTPIAKSVGVVFVHMRKRMCKFRIDYTRLGNDNIRSKAVLIGKNIFPICYYFSSNVHGVLFHIGGRKKE